MPYAFSEHGAIMAANVLNSKRAVRMSVFVVRAFVKLRETALRYKEIAAKISELERKVGTHDHAIASTIAAIRQLMSSPAGGRTDPQGKRVGLGALLVGYYDDGDFVFAGKIGTGFDNELLLKLRAQLDQIEIAKPSFTIAVGLPRLRAHWVRPEIVVQVGFIQWTVHGKLRHPRLLGVRNDKSAREVVRE